MVELAVIMSMITVTSTVSNILGVIIRRSSSCLAMTRLVSKCAELFDKVRELLKLLEGGVQVPHDTGEIATALSHRREQFDVILQNPEKMKRRTRHTNPVDRTERFIAGQGWAKKKRVIHYDLVDLRNSIQRVL